MSGTFTETNRPALPGAYTRYTAKRRVTLPTAPGGVVAVPFTADWGPVNEVVQIGSFGDYEDVYGASLTPGRIAVYGAFVGEGVEGYAGAAAVLAYRAAGSGATKASVTVNNPASAPAFTFTAKYEGVRGNALRIVVSPITTGRQTISVLDGTVTLESYTYTIGDAGALAGVKSRVDSTGDWVTGAVVLEGTTGLLAGTYSLAGGADGAALSGTDWTTVMNAFKYEEFAFFAPYDLPYAEGAGASAVRDAVASLVAWRKAEETEGHRFTLVVGGVLDEPIADASARAAALADEGTITVGGPGFDDDLFGPLSTSQLAPRYAGIRAQRGESMATHFARLAGGKVRPAASGAPVALTELEQAVNGGVVVLQRDRYSVAPTRVVKDVNTYTADTPDKPRSIYGNPKFVLSMQQFANEAEAEIEREMVGKTVVTQATRDSAAARVLRLAKARERSGAFGPGTVVQAVPGSDTDEFIQLRVTLTFGRALAQLFITGTVQ